MRTNIKDMIKLNDDGSVKKVNPLIKLACINLIRRGVAEKVTVGNETKYIQDANLVLIEAFSILNIASKTGQIEKIRSYFEEEKI